jgi:hypothetical protein
MPACLSPSFRITPCNPAAERSLSAADNLSIHSRIERNLQPKTGGFFINIHHE